MEHHEADIRPVAGFGTSEDDATRFLRALRQLRSSAGLGHAELAARAHYPYDSIKAAEVGPSLPDLPVLCAFVRGCGGTAEEWEERWRSLTKSPSLPVSATRQSGQSDAATAGARINSEATPGDGPDPTVIVAALDRFAKEMASPDGAYAVSEPPAARSLPDFASSPLSPGKLDAGDKAAGWDPIRVSAAWPVLNHATTVAEPARGAEVPGDAGQPWDASPWPTDPSGAASWARPGATGPGGAGPYDAGTSAGVAGPAAAHTADGTPASVTGGSAFGSGSSGHSPRTTIVVVAVALLCVVAALLATFA